FRFPNPADQCVFSQDRIVTRHKDGMLRVWNDSGTQIATAGPLDDVESWAVGLGGPYFVAGRDRRRLWEIKRYGVTVDTVPMEPGFYRGGTYTLSGDARSEDARSEDAQFDVVSGKKTEMHLRLDNARGLATSESLRARVFLQRDADATQDREVLVY